MTFPSVLFFFLFKEGAEGCCLAFPPIRLNVSSCMHKEGRIKLKFADGQAHPAQRRQILSPTRTELSCKRRYSSCCQVFFIELLGDKSSAVIVLHKCSILLCSVCSGQLFFPLLLFLSFPQILCLEAQTWACVSQCARGRFDER